MTEQAKTIPKIARREAEIGKVDERKVNVCFMTEAPCRNWYVPEICLCKEENVDLTRFKNGIAPVLFNHNRDCVIGRIEEITFDNGRANATIAFDDDEQSNCVLSKINSGSLRGVSVGYVRSKCTRVEASEDRPNEFMGMSFTETTDVTTLWELLEISIVSVPADNDTGVGRNLDDDNAIVVEMLKRENREKEILEMGEEKLKTQDVNVEAERQAAVIAERERSKSIADMCQRFNIETKDQNAYIAEGKTVEQVRDAIMDILAERQKPLSQRVEFGKDENEKVRSAMAIALGVKHGVIAADADEAKGTEKYGNLSLRGIAEECLSREGVSEIRYSSVDRVFERAMGSGAFLGVIDDFANKVKLAAYAEQPFIWKNFVSFGQNKDFKPNYKYELGLDGLPYEMPHESAEFKYTEMGDKRVSTMISTVGKAIRLTREIFINDDLGQVADAIAMQAGGFARLKEMKFFNALVSGVSYGSDYGNVATSTGISADVYDELTQCMLTQMDVNGEGYVGVVPSFIIAPTNQRLAHKVLINSSAKVGQENPGVINPVQGDFSLFVSPYLSGNYYYAVASPKQMRGIEYTTLNGVDTIQSRTVVPNAYLGIEYQMWQDFGFNVLDYRAFARASKS